MQISSWSVALTRRRAFQALGSGAAAGLLAACRSQPGGEAPKPETSKAPVSIVYATFFPEDRNEIMRPGFEAFAERYPHIKFTIETPPDYRNKLRTLIATGSASDCFIHDVWSAAWYYDSGAIYDIGPFLRRDKIDLKRDYALIGIENWCGKTYGMPFYVTSMVLAYNKTLLKQYGAPDPWERWNGKWTWADFLAVAKQVTKDTNGDGKPDTWGLMMDGNGINNIDRNYQVWCTSNGGETYDVEKMRYTLDDPKTIEGIDFLVKMVHEHKVMVGPEDAAEIAKALPGEPFIHGIIAFRQESSGRLANYRRQVGDRFEWDVVPYPSSGPNVPSIGHSDADVNNVYAHGKNIEAAYEFVKWIGSEVMQKIMGQNKLLIPALLKAQTDPDGFMKPPPQHLNAHTDFFKTGQYRTSFYHYRGLEALAEIDKGLRDAMYLVKSTRQAMLDANQAANALVQYGSCRQEVVWKPRQ